MRFLFATTCLFLSFCIIVNIMVALGGLPQQGGHTSEFKRVQAMLDELPPEKEQNPKPPPEGMEHVPLERGWKLVGNRWVRIGPMRIAISNPPR